MMGHIGVVLHTCQAMQPALQKAYTTEIGQTPREHAQNTASKRPGGGVVRHPTHVTSAPVSVSPIPHNESEEKGGKEKVVGVENSLLSVVDRIEGSELAWSPCFQFIGVDIMLDDQG